MTDPCIQEGRIARVETYYHSIKQGITDIKTSQNELSKTLNGQDGVITQAALNKQSIKRAWYFIAAIFIGLLSAGGLKAFYS